MAPLRPRAVAVLFARGNSLIRVASTARACFAVPQAFRAVADDTCTRASFPRHPYSLLNELFVIAGRNGSPSVVYREQKSRTGGSVWSAHMSIDWPVKLESSTPYLGRRALAKEQAAAELVLELRKMGFYSEAFKPQLRSPPTEVTGTPRKPLLSALVELLQLADDKRVCATTFEEKRSPTGTSLWSARMTINWPIAVAATSPFLRNRSTARAAAAADIVRHLRKKGYFTSSFEPRLVRDEDVEKIRELHTAPVRISLDDGLREEVDRLADDVEMLKQEITSLSIASTEDAPSEPVTLCSSEAMEHDEDVVSTSTLDIMTGRPLVTLSNDDEQRRNLALFTRQNALRSGRGKGDVLAMLHAREELPIALHRKELCELIDANQVVVVVGETGCGKTTQVPQYIFEDSISRLEGSSCNIVVTQPRRLSACAVSKRIATERFESLGSSVGYRVRLESVPVHSRGGIVFLTPGLLLRCVLMNENMHGVSHVVIDEAHERDLATDFLLVVMKRVMEENKRVKLVVMSASVDAGKFADYFGGCPVLNVAGRTFPVKEFFLPQVRDVLAICGETGRAEGELDHDLVTNTLKYIHEKKPPGAVLCFLPTWNDIQLVKDRVLKSLDVSASEKSVHLCFAHSKMSLAEQSKIFTRPPEGVRKIVLATNIAETSLTIDDVVYVVNAGLRKNLVYDHARMVDVVECTWASRASQLQRKGRAGRVAEGECYHMFSAETMNAMSEYDVPELQRVALENAILLAKLHARGASKALDFFATALDPPSTANVESALNSLKALELLDTDENLTRLGTHLSHFTCHPQLSRALFYSVLLGCVNPMLNVVSTLESARDVLALGAETTNAQKRELMQRFAGSTLSDHVAVANVLNVASDARNFYVGAPPIDDTSSIFNEKSVEYLRGVGRIHAANLRAGGLIDDVDCVYEKGDKDDMVGHPNEFATDPFVLSLALALGFRTNLARRVEGRLTRKRVLWNDSVYLDLGATTLDVAPASVVFDGDSSAQFFAYFNKQRDANLMMTLVRDLSPIEPIVAALASGEKLARCSTRTRASAHVLTIDGDERFSFGCTDEDAERVLKLRRTIDSLRDVFLLWRRESRVSDERGRVQRIAALRNDLLRILRRFSPASRNEEGDSIKFLSGRSAPKLRGWLC